MSHVCVYVWLQLTEQEKDVEHWFEEGKKAYALKIALITYMQRKFRYRLQLKLHRKMKKFQIFEKSEEKHVKHLLKKVCVVCVCVRVCCYDDIKLSSLRKSRSQKLLTRPHTHPTPYSYRCFTRALTSVELSRKTKSTRKPTLAPCSIKPESSRS